MRAKEFIKFLTESTALLEINMSSRSLQKLTANIGAFAGMEFEMIVPPKNTSDVEFKKDYDQDEKAYSIDDVVEFFGVDWLRDELNNSYSNWLDEIRSERWANKGADIVYDLVKLNLGDKSEEEIDAAFDKEWEEQGEIYQSAEIDFAQAIENRYTEAKWLKSEFPFMSYIETEFDVDWPHIQGVENETIKAIADDFAKFINQPINSSEVYHGALREPGVYAAEPDGSITPEENNERGVEIISPYMPFNDMLADLDKVKAWAEGRGAYTNNSTGLHMNISIPSKDFNNLDYVKLALLLGDERVLNEFGRITSIYANSAMRKIKHTIANNPDTVDSVMSKIRYKLNTEASRLIHSGITEKMSSINVKDGYVEFRSPGGDWLDTNFSILKDTLLRFIVCLDAALDETKYREEYAKKLYKLLSPAGDSSNTIEYFSKFSAGLISKSELISRVRQARNIAVPRKQSLSTSRPSNTVYQYGIYQVANPDITIHNFTATRDTAPNVFARELQQLGYNIEDGYNYKAELAPGLWAIDAGNNRIHELEALSFRDARHQAQIWIAAQSPEFRRSIASEEISITPIRPVQSVS